MRRNSGLRGDKRKMAIRPYRGYAAPVDNEHAKASWRLLKSAIQKIHKQDASGLSYEELYRNAYNMVLHKHETMLYNGLEAVLTEHLVSVCQTVRSAAENGTKADFLPTLNNEWNKHRISMLMVRDILMYLDKQYVAKNEQVLTVYDLGLSLFRKHVIDQVQNKSFIQECLLESIAKERASELIDRSLVKDVLEMLMEVGVSSSAVYEGVFEAQFLQTSADHYSACSQEFLSQNDSVTYVRKVEKWLSDELGRVDAIMDKQTRSRLQLVVETETIAQHRTAIVGMDKGGVVNLIVEHRLAPLSELFRVLKRVPGGIEEIRDSLLDHLQSTGTKLIHTVLEPLPLIKQLIDLKVMYYDTVEKAFANEQLFTDGVQRKFAHVVNLNKRMPEFLSLFLDDALRKQFRTLSEEEAEEVLSNSLAIFRFLEEKDLFERYYKSHLAKRLLSSKNVSEEFERNMMLKLKTESGTHYTQKLDQMFKDMSISEETNRAFASFCADKKDTKNEDGLLDIALEVKVVTLGTWPFGELPSCILPTVFERAKAAYDQFYGGKYSGRRLMWAYNHGTVEMKARFKKNTHTLVMSTLQGVVLSVFNDLSDEEDAGVTYEEILERTRAPEADLKRALQSLACTKQRVLTKSPKGREILAGDRFTVYMTFTSKMHVVRIPNITAPSKESGSACEKTRADVNESRKHMVDAAVVRVMKSRKTLSHSDLVRDVIQALHARFLPTPVVIKTRIEHLIEREFLMRTPENHSIYAYLA